MPRRIRILPYRQGSQGARNLANALGGRVLRLQGSTFRPRRDDLIINWGNTDPQRAHVYPARFLQLPNSVRYASNKLLFFNCLAELDAEIIPQFWTQRNVIPDDAFPIVCRTVLAGHSGEGIIIANNREELVDAPLYVKYVKKQDEYRIHVGRCEDTSIIISTQRKARRTDHENPNWQVRNLSNGFIYARTDVNPPECVFDYARRALLHTGLDFGAVDVIYNAREDRAYVLEVNTAPGLTGTTVDDYVTFFRGF